MPESGRLYDEEAARASSAGPFVLPPARGGTEGAEVGQRLAVLESQILRDLEGGDQRGVKRTTSGVKGLTLPAVPTPLLPEAGEEVVQQSRETVTPTPQDRKSLLRVRLEGVRAAFNATKPIRLHHGGRKDVLRTMAIRAMTFVAEGEERERETDSEGNPHSAPTGAQEEEPQQREQRRHKRVRHFEQRNSDGDGKPLKNNASCRGPARRADDVIRRSDQMRAPLEERGRMIDVANLASKYYAALRAEAREKINPGQHAELRTLAEALDSLWAGQLGRAGDMLAQRLRAVEANSVERIGWLRARFIEALPPSQITSVPVAMRAEIDKQARSEFRLSGSGAIRLAGRERSRKGRVERDESAMDRQREKRGEGGSERRGSRKEAKRMEAGSSQSQWNSSSAPLRDWGPRPDSKGEACDSPQAAVEERLHSARFARCQKSSPGSPTARVVLSPADDHEDDQAGSSGVGLPCESAVSA